MRNRTSMYLLAVTAGLALAACGDDTKQTVDSGVDLAGDTKADTKADVAADAAGDAVADAVAEAPTDAAPALSGTITISGMAFSPLHLTVAPGAVITVKNDDSVLHTVTSEASPNSFTPDTVSGVSFDTGNIAAGGTATITIPATASPGTVVPFYCKVHTSTMVTPNGTITVQ